MGNELVAEVEPSVSPEDGIAVVDFGVDARNAASNGDWCEAGIDIGAAAIDVGLAALDPFGTLLSSAFAWAMEHVSPLPEMLDALAGNQDVVQANAETWANVSEALKAAAADMEQSVAADTAQWRGPAVDVYKVVGAGEAKLVEGVAANASAVGAAVSGAGTAVMIVRTTVRDLIASAMADLVKVLARQAVALGLTLGAATPLLVADVIATVAKWATKVSEWLQKIVRSCKSLAQIIEKIRPILDKATDGLKKLDNLSFGGEAVFHGARNSFAVGSTNDDQAYWEK